MLLAVHGICQYEIIGMVGAYNAVLFICGVGVWGVLRLHDLSFSLVDVSAENLHAAVSSEASCPFALDIEQKWIDRPREEVVVDGGRGASFFWPEKLGEMLFLMGDINNLNSWFRSQLSIYHLYEEVLSSEKFWITFCCLTVINVAIFIIVFEPFLHLSKSALMNEEYRKAEAEHFEVTMRKFVVEKMLILGFVVIRSHQSVQREKILPAGILPRSGAATDASMFAIWYSIVWSVSSIASTAVRRFEALQPSLCPNIRRTLLRRLAAVLFACVCGSASMTSLAVSAFYILHPVYALIMTCESTRILLQSMYGVSRVVAGGLISKDSESDTAADAESGATTYYVKRVTDCSCDALDAVSYALYIVVGTMLNGKLLPLCFVPRFTLHVSRLVGHLISHRRGEPAPRLLFD